MSAKILSKLEENKKTRILFLQRLVEVKLKKKGTFVVGVKKSKLNFESFKFYFASLLAVTKIANLRSLTSAKVG